jgi:two-component system CitB family sensor kinase
VQSRARSLLPPPRRPEIRSALAAGDPKHIVEGPAQEITAAARSANVVVTDRNDIRFSHPNRR